MVNRLNQEKTVKSRIEFDPDLYAKVMILSIKTKRSKKQTISMLVELGFNKLGESALDIAKDANPSNKEIYEIIEEILLNKNIDKK